MGKSKPKRIRHLWQVARPPLATLEALGASPWRLARLFLIEGLLIAIVGGLAGVAMAMLVLRAIVVLAPTERRAAPARVA